MLKYFFTAIVCFLITGLIKGQSKPGDGGLPNGPFRNMIGLNEGLKWSPELVQKSADIGIKILRKDLSWNEIEKKKGIYDFTENDEYLAECQKFGIRVMFILGKTNKIYDPTYTVPIPGNYLWEPYTSYIKACIEHYRGKNIIWELWNEPDVYRMWGAMTSWMWVDHSIAVMHLIRTVEPDATIAGPGAGYAMRFHKDNWSWYMFRMLREKGKTDIYWQNLNIWTGHEYTTEAPDNLIIDGEEMYDLQRKILDAHGGKNIPYAVGERGFTSNPVNSPFNKSQRYAFVGNPDRQVNYYIRQCLWGIYKEPQAFIINYVNYDVYNSGKAIVGTEAGRGIKTMLDVLGDYNFKERLDMSDPDIVLLRFESHNNSRYAVWNRANKTTFISLPISNAQVKVFDRKGNFEKISTGPQSLDISIGESPLFIVPESH